MTLLGRQDQVGLFRVRDVPCKLNDQSLLAGD